MLDLPVSVPEGMPLARDLAESVLKIEAKAEEDNRQK